MVITLSSMGGSLARTTLIITAFAISTSQAESLDPHTARHPAVTSIGTCFNVDPVFSTSIAEHIAAIRQQIVNQRDQGHLIAYISTPLSSKGGGYFPLNNEIADFMKSQLEARYGGLLWALNPAATSISPVDGKDAGGGEYMFMWTQILAGDDGLGANVDLVEIAGPSDFRGYFGGTDGGALDSVARYRDLLTKADPDFRKAMQASADAPRRFLAYYGLKASSSFSSGSHDEWNVFVEVNRRRKNNSGVAEMIPIVFDGRALSPLEFETRASSGYEIPCR